MDILCIIQPMKTIAAALLVLGACADEATPSGFISEDPYLSSTVGEWVITIGMEDVCNYQSHTITLGLQPYGRDNGLGTMMYVTWDGSNPDAASALGVSVPDDHRAWVYVVAVNEIYELELFDGGNGNATVRGTWSHNTNTIPGPCTVDLDNAEVTVERF